MNQLYLLSVVYLFFFSGLMLSDRYGHKLLILLNIKNYYYNKKKMKTVMLFTGFALLIGLCFFPMNPGPVIIGDLLPELSIIDTLFFQLNQLDKDSSSLIVADRKKEKNGLFLLFAALIHFIAPGIVVL